MGILFFFSWLKTHIGKNRFIPILKTETVKNNGKKDVNVDTLLMDCNGIIHMSCQKIYQYGDYSLGKQMLVHAKKTTKNLQLEVFADICAYIETIIKFVNPSKRLVICIDGCSPVSKCNQQRRRRFKATKDRKVDDEETFDSNAITPGSIFLDFLSKYIDWFIRKKVMEDEKWRSLEIIFSNEKQPGEGEHKLINYLRYYAKKDETFAIHGMDSDLIMLALASGMENIYIFREDNKSFGNFLLIDIGGIKHDLIRELKWEGDSYNATLAIYDFIFLCFLVGNDFLPHVPYLDIFSEAIETLIKAYKCVGEHAGHICAITEEDNRVYFQPKIVWLFFEALGKYEETLIEVKALNSSQFYDDPLLIKYTKLRRSGDEPSYEVNLEGYKKAYYHRKCEAENKEDIDQMCTHYLDGMQWVLSYYTKGCPNWKWFYPYDYAPFVSDLAIVAKTYKHVVHPRTFPVTPFQQLLAVLPPKSARLLPPTLAKLITEESSPLHKYYPTEFEIDLDGLRADYAGIVRVPFVNIKELRDEYFRLIDTVSKADLKRNMLGKGFVYNYDRSAVRSVFNSYYGDLSTQIKIRTIEL